MKDCGMKYREILGYVLLKGINLKTELIGGQNKMSGSGVACYSVND